MAKLYTEIPQKLQQFIENQKIFFVATATADGRINLSPKGMDSLRVLGPNRVAWLNVTGSGNETAAHVQENPRMTLMFTAFQDNYVGEREQLNAWAAKKGEEGVEAYWKETNHTSLDGKPTRFA